MKNNIASERVRLSWSQEDLANEVGVTRDIVKSWENEETPIKAPMLCALADTFGCSIDYLMNRTDNRLPYSKTVA